MKKVFIIFCLLSLLCGCNHTGQKKPVSLEGEKMSSSECIDPLVAEKIHEEMMSNKETYKITDTRPGYFLYLFPRRFASFKLPAVYRLNFYDNSRRAVLWERTEVIFNCSIIDDKELIDRLQKAGYSEVKSFNKETEFAWREFSDDFVEPKFFEQKYIVEDKTYGSKTYYNKVVICKPFNNPDAKENEWVVFFDIVSNNRRPYYEEVIETIDGRPVTGRSDSSLEWALIEPTPIE